MTGEVYAREIRAYEVPLPRPAQLEAFQLGPAKDDLAPPAPVLCTFLHEAR